MRALVVLTAALVAAALASAAWPTDAAAVTPVRWCGTDAAQSDRLPDAVSGRQVHVVYAIPADGADRFAELASPIATDVGAVVEWWRRQDAARAPRFDLFAFQGCGSPAGMLDLTFVRLPHPAGRYLNGTSRLLNIADDVAALPFALVDPDKKYLVYYDGPVTADAGCGAAYSHNPGEGGRYAIGGVWLRTLGDCGGDVGFGGYRAKSFAHELVHQLGALPPGAPHPCPESIGHPCDAENDVLYGRPPPFEFLDEYVLDAGRDDYYGHSGAWWDLRDSQWLRRLDVAEFPLIVSLQGAGEGDVVRSDLPGIACPPACSIPWEGATKILFEVTEGDPEARRFRGWSGACSGADECSVTIDRALALTATFGPAYYAVRVTVVGRGSVVTDAFTCARRCSELLDAEETFGFRARPVKGWRFVRWRGACSGRRTCSFPVTRDTQLTAVFERAKPKRKR